MSDGLIHQPEACSRASSGPAEHKRERSDLGGREGEARPDGGRDTTTLPPYRAVCKKSSKMALSPTAPRDSADGHSRTNSVKRAICPRNVRGMSAEGIT